MKKLIEDIVETARLAHQNKDMDFTKIETVIREEFKGRLIKNESAVSNSAFSGVLCAVAEQLEEAAEDVADWGAYASPYFQEKHDLKADIDKYKTYAALVREVTGI